MHLTQLDALIAEIPHVRNTGAFSVEHTRWKTRIQSLLSKAFGIGSRLAHDFDVIQWKAPAVSIISRPDEAESARIRYEHGDFIKKMNQAEGLLTAARDELLEQSQPHAQPFKVHTVKYDLFISYATPDTELANELRDDFAKAGLSSFLAEKDLRLARKWEESIRLSLQQSRYLLLLLTPNSKERPWVLLETGAAWALEKPIIPVVVHVPFGDLVEPIRQYQAMRIETAAQRADLIRHVKQA